MRERWRFGAATAATTSAIRMYWGTALLLTGTVAVCLAVVLPITSLLGSAERPFASRLLISTVRGGRLGLPWIDAQTPAETQQRTTEVLFGLLAGMAVSTFGASAVTVVALFGARAASRTPELAVRRAVGASRRELRKAALLEAGLIAASAVLVGGVVGAHLARVAVAEWPGGVKAPMATMSLTVVFVLAGVVMASALLPIVFARQGRIVEAEPEPRAIFAPAVLQLAAGLAVLTTSALVQRHAVGVTERSRGHADGTVLQLTTSPGRAAELSRRYAAMLQLLKRPSRSLSLTSPGTLMGLGPISTVMTDCGICSEGGIPLKFNVFYATHQFVSPDSFQALGIHLVAGRTLALGDRWGTRRVAVVNRQLAMRHFQRDGAVGRQMRVGDDKNWYTVVGVVDDPPAVGFGTRLQPRFTVYLSILQHPVTSADLLIHASGEPHGSSLVRQTALTVLGPLVARVRETRESHLYDAEAAPFAWFARWIQIQGWAITLTATVGMFAVMRLWVVSLRPELGVRRALGAKRSHLLVLVLRQAAAVALIGVAAGLWFGSAVWNVLPTIMMDAATWDTRIVARVAVLLILATVSGALFPALGAMRASPIRLMSDSEQ